MFLVMPTKSLFDIIDGAKKLVYEIKWMLLTRKIYTNLEDGLFEVYINGLRDENYTGFKLDFNQIKLIANKESFEYYFELMTAPIENYVDPSNPNWEKELRTIVFKKVIEFSNKESINEL